MIELRQRVYRHGEDPEASPWMPTMAQRDSEYVWRYPPQQPGLMVDVQAVIPNTDTASPIKTIGSAGGTVTLGLDIEFRDGFHYVTVTVATGP